MAKVIGSDALGALKTWILNKLSSKSDTGHTHTTAQITNFPTIPSVGNGTITINQGGVNKGSFTTNQSGNTTINLDGGGGGGTTSLVASIESNTDGTMILKNADGQSLGQINVYARFA